MLVTARHRTLRMSPQKVRLLLPQIRGMAASEAIARLRLMPQAAAIPVAKVITSAVANAEHNYSLAAADLVVKQASADEGPSLKRFRPRARGRADQYQRRTSHVTIILEALPQAKPKPASTAKAAAKRAAAKLPARPTKSPKAADDAAKEARGRSAVKAETARAVNREALTKKAGSGHTTRQTQRGGSKKGTAGG